MAVTNQQLLESLNAMPDAIATALAQALASQQIAPADPVPSNNGNTGKAAAGDQPTIYTYFLPHGSKVKAIAEKINGLAPGQSLKYERVNHGRINEAFARSSYSEPAFDAKTRKRVLTRRTSKSGKTVADGKVLEVHVPKKVAADNQITVTRIS